MAWEPPASLADFAEVWQTWLPAIENRSDLHLVARAKSDGRCLGIIGLHALQSGTPELGIWLRYDVHGMGLGRELIGAVAAWASENAAIEYFEYPVAEDNIASRRIAEAYGGQYCGASGSIQNIARSSTAFRPSPPQSGFNLADR